MDVDKKREMRRNKTNGEKKRAQALKKENGCQLEPDGQVELVVLKQPRQGVGQDNPGRSP